MSGMLTDNRAQGAFEYVLLLAGVILVTVIAILILRGSVLPSVNRQINNNIAGFQNTTKFTVVCNTTGGNYSNCTMS